MSIMSIITTIIIVIIISIIIITSIGDASIDSPCVRIGTDRHWIRVVMHMGVTGSVIHKRCPTSGTEPGENTQTAGEVHMIIVVVVVIIMCNNNNDNA